MTGPDPVSVAVVGTGRMGAAMVGRLRSAGHRVVAYNRTAERARATGAEVAGTPREAAASADLVLVSLADDAAVRASYGGDDGLVAGLRAGAVVVETSTVAPETVRALAADVGARGATLLDAPVSGSVPVVESGELTFLVGGDAEAARRAAPVFEPLGKRVFHLGGVGAGAVMKLAVNSVVHGLNEALAEALVLAEKAGVQRSSAYEVFASSAIAAPYVIYKRAAFEDPEGTPVAFRLELVAKDLVLIEELARASGARMDQLAATRRVVEEALAAGLGDADLSAVAQLLRRDA
ncbi:MAG TPA: NAD(P)-dependent oxidoreductase [Micromonosporaceae bacterium]|nr:NAD(P)-dependent oxidoreductase [Micromonosporaceae bacterium]